MSALAAAQKTVKTTTLIYPAVVAVLNTVTTPKTLAQVVTAAGITTEEAEHKLGLLVDEGLMMCTSAERSSRVYTAT